MPKTVVEKSLVLSLYLDLHQTWVGSFLCFHTSFCGNLYHLYTGYNNNLFISALSVLGTTDEVVHCGFQNGLWTQFPRIPQSLHPVANSAFSYYWSRWQTPLWPDSLNSSTFLCSLSSPPLFPQGHLPSRSLLLDSSAAESWQLDFQQAQRTSPSGDARSC